MPRWCGGSVSIGRPSSRIVPAVGASKPASSISVVVLPEPDGPEQRDELAGLRSCRFRSSTAGAVLPG